MVGAGYQDHKFRAVFARQSTTASFVRKSKFLFFFFIWKLQVKSGCFSKYKRDHAPGINLTFCLNFSKILKSSLTVMPFKRPNLKRQVTYLSKISIECRILLISINIWSKVIVAKGEEKKDLIAIMIGGCDGPFYWT